MPAAADVDPAEEEALSDGGLFASSPASNSSNGSRADEGDTGASPVLTEGVTSGVGSMTPPPDSTAVLS